MTIIVCMLLNWYNAVSPTKTWSVCSQSTLVRIHETWFVFVFFVNTNVCASFCVTTVMSATSICINWSIFICLFQNHPDVPHLRVAPPVARHYPAAAVPRYNAAHMPPHPAHWGRSSLRISGGRIVANPMLRMIQTNITTLREVQREARRINILVWVLILKKFLIYLPLKF